ncbi:hypothetical protein ACIKTA_04415, partial [Hansschlegelia beijingensis]
AQTSSPFDQSGARQAAVFNRKLWTVFLSSVMRSAAAADLCAGAPGGGRAPASLMSWRPQSS